MKRLVLIIKKYGVFHVCVKYDVHKNDHELAETLDY